MKVLYHRTDFYGANIEGGVFTLINGFASGAQALGHRVAIASSGYMTPLEGVPFYYLPYGKLLRNLPEILHIPYNHRVVRLLENVIQKESPDFIYQRHSAFNYSPFLIQKRYGLPVILQCDGPEYWVKKHWGKAYLEDILRWSEEIALHSASALTVISTVLRDIFIDMGIPSEKIIVNTNGVDPERFAPTVSGSALREEYGLQSKFVIGFVGTFGVWHGVPVLAESLRETLRRIPHAHCLLVGDGALRPEVEAIIKRDGLGEHITITGLVPHHRIPAYMAACDVLVSPTVQNTDGSEFFGSPTKLFEYMAMQKPVVASGVGQIASVINHGRNGLLVPERTPLALAEAFEQIADDTVQASSLALNARNDVLAYYTWSVNAERVFDRAQHLV